MFANIIVRHGSVSVEQSDIRALDYVVDSALKKIFDTNSKSLYSNVSWYDQFELQLVMFFWKGNATFSMPIGLQC